MGASQDSEGKRVESRRDTDWMWLPSAHFRHIAPDALFRRVSTKFHGKRLVGSDAARDLKVQLSGSTCTQAAETPSSASSATSRHASTEP